MEDAAVVLIIILASVLSVFLVVAIILVIKIIKLLKVLNTAAVKASEVVGNVESASEVLKKAAGPLAIGKLLMNVVNVVSKKRKG
ncbi:MAG: hypothetical protein M3Q14_01265 [bacterium]|nr:hypothetical protein [bacterium]